MPPLVGSPHCLPKTNNQVSLGRIRQALAPVSQLIKNPRVFLLVTWCQQALKPLKRESVCHIRKSTRENNSWSYLRQKKNSWPTIWSHLKNNLRPCRCRLASWTSRSVRLKKLHKSTTKNINSWWRIMISWINNIKMWWNRVQLTCSKSRKKLISMSRREKRKCQDVRRTTKSWKRQQTMK